ncbi:MAG: AsmA family protein [Pseudomonadota bacterium]
MALPLIPGSTTTRAPIDTGQVNAAPRHTLVIHDEPIAIAPEIGLTIGKGTIKIADDDAANGQTADHDSNIASGKAGFVVEDGEATIFDQVKPPAGRTEPTDISPMRAALIQGRFEAVRFKSSKLRVRLPGGGVAVLSDADAVVAPQGRTKRKISGKGVWQGQDTTFVIEEQLLPAPETRELISRPDASGNVPLTRGQTKQRTGAETLLPPPTSAIVISFKSELLTLRFEGTVSVGPSPAGPDGPEIVFAGQATIRSPNLQRLAFRLGSNLRLGLGLQDMVFRAKTRWHRRLLAFDQVSLTLDGQRANGTIAVRDLTGRPKVSGTLDFETLDLKPYLADYVESGQRSGALQKTSAIAEIPGDLGVRDGRDPLTWWQRTWQMMRAPFIRSVDLDFRLSANKLATGSVSLGRAAATLNVRDGVLRAHLAEFSLSRGTGIGQVKMDFNSAETNFAFRGKIEGLELKSFSHLFTGTVAASGLADVTFDLAAQGSTRAKLIQTLTGRISAQSKDQATPRIPISLTRLRGSDTPQIISQIAGETKTKAVKAEFTFLNGRAYCRRGDLKLTDTSIKIRGVIHLLTGRIEMVAREYAKTPAKGSTNDGTASASRAQATAMLTGLKEARAVRAWQLTGPFAEILASPIALIQRTLPVPLTPGSEN